MMLKFLLVIAVLNTILFTIARWLEVSIWWVIGIEIVGYILWKAWSNPAQQLVNQAAYMNWVAIGMEKDEDGYRDTLLKKEGVTAKVSFQDRCVYLVEPYAAGPFKDFIEVDHYLQQASK